MSFVNHINVYAFIFCIIFLFVLLNIILIVWEYVVYADMAELADAYGSGPCESNFMQVQVLLSAPNKNRNFDTKLRFCFFAQKPCNKGIF